MTVEQSSEPEDIVYWISGVLAEDDALTSRSDGAAFFNMHRGREWAVPLSRDAHDCHIVLSSLAQILDAHYAFYIEAEPVEVTATERMIDDFHRLVIVPFSTVPERGPLPAHLAPLQRGVDHFTGDPRHGRAQRIPYAGQPAK